MLLILHIVVADHSGHAGSSVGVPSGSAGRCSDPTPSHLMPGKATSGGTNTESRTAGRSLGHGVTGETHATRT